MARSKPNYLHRTKRFAPSSMGAAQTRHQLKHARTDDKLRRRAESQKDEPKADAAMVALALVVSIGDRLRAKESA